jgi:hypothetical protein
MSSVPPNIVGPILQASLQQQHAAQIEDAAQSRQSEQSSEMARKADQVAHSVEDTDDDTTVHGNAAGAGGQGRAFSEPEEDVEENEGESADQITRDEDGQIHIDIQA